MANVSNLTGFLKDVANAIREKDGITGNIYPKDYDNRIRNISSGGQVNNLYSFSFYNGKANSYDNDIASINTTSVQNLDNTFYNCTNLTGLSEFQTTNVKSMKNMLYNCKNLTNNSLCNLVNMLPLYNNITDSTKSQRLTYLGLTEEQIANIPEEFINIAEEKGWSLQQLMEYLISYDDGNGNNTVYNLPYNLKTEGNNGKTLREYFINTLNAINVFNLTIQNTELIQNWRQMFHTSSKGIFLFDFPNINTSNARDLSYLFSYQNNNLKNANLNILENYDLSNVSNLTAMFQNTKINYLPILNVSNVRDFSGMFWYSGLENGNSIENLKSWDFSNARNIDHMFYLFSNASRIPMNLHDLSLTSLIKCDDPFHSLNLIGSIPNWNMNNCYSMSYAFEWQKNLTGSLPNWNLSKCRYLDAAFYNCINLTGIIPNWNLNNVSHSLVGTFSGCSNLTGSLPNWNLSSSSSFSMGNSYRLGTFSYCSNLTGTIPNWDLSRCNSIVYLLQGCSNLTGTIPNWDLSRCNSIGSAFSGCYNLTGHIPNWNLSSLANNDYSEHNLISSAFYNCSNLTGSIPNWNLKINNCSLGYTFYNCKKLTGNIPNLAINSITNLYKTFKGCTNLIGVPGLNVINCNCFTSCFEECVNLIDFPNDFIINIQLINTSNTVSTWSSSSTGLMVINGYLNCFKNCYNLSRNSIYNIVNIFMPAKTANFPNQNVLNENNIEVKEVYNKRNEFFSYIGLDNTEFLTKLQLNNQILSLIAPYNSLWPDTYNYIQPFVVS